MKKVFTGRGKQRSLRVEVYVGLCAFVSSKYVWIQVLPLRCLSGDVYAGLWAFWQNMCGFVFMQGLRPVFKHNVWVEVLPQRDLQGAVYAGLCTFFFAVYRFVTLSWSNAHVQVLYPKNVFKVTFIQQVYVQLFGRMYGFRSCPTRCLQGYAFAGVCVCSLLQ